MHSTLRCAAIAALAWGGAAAAHDGHRHAGEPAGPKAKSARQAPGPAAAPDLSFLAGRIGGDFDLVDQSGKRRRLADFAGRRVLLFFGYANCEAICSAALPLMADAVDLLPADQTPVDLVMITVDPARDTVEGLREGLRKYDSRFIGLTGPEANLRAAWKAFSIDVSEVARDWRDAPILAHGSFIYLLGADGKLATLMPPVLTPEQVAAIVRRYP